MFALADAGFHISVETVKQSVGAKNLRILEVGWGQAGRVKQPSANLHSGLVMVWVLGYPGKIQWFVLVNHHFAYGTFAFLGCQLGRRQGISGRRLMDNADAAGLPELRVAYEVVELHPAVAADARAEAQRRPKDTVCSIRVHEGPWQKVLPKLAANAYDLIFYDPLNISPRYIGEKQLYESWGLPACVFEALQPRPQRENHVKSPFSGGHLKEAIKNKTSPRALCSSSIHWNSIGFFCGNQVMAKVDSSYVTTAEVGRAMAAKLQERGLEICSDIQALEKNRLREWFGVKGETLWLNAQGLDQESSLVPAQRKSVSAEMNWGIRCPDKAAAVKILFEVAKQLKDRLAVCKLRANHLTLKLKIAIPGWVEPIKKGGHGQCDDISRSSALPSAESSEAGDLEVLQRCALQLYDMISPDPVRLRGLGLAARLGSSGADGSNSRSPKKASAGTSAGSGSIARWLRKAPELRKQEPSKEPAEPAEPADVVDLDALEHQELRGDFGRCSSPPYGNIRSDTVPCPVCGRQIPAANADAHVNSHFDQSAVQPVQPVQPSRKRLRFSSEQQGARPADSDECVIIL
eukprot:s793_g7.t2